MANEAVMLYEIGPAIPFTIDDGAGIEKGTICKNSDPMTAAASDGDEDVVAGIAASEKISGDGKVKLGMYRSGIFKVYASGSITAGDALITASSSGGANYVASAGVDSEDIIGIAFESASNGETLAMELKPFTMNLA